MAGSTTRTRYTNAKAEISEAGHRLGLAADELQADDAHNPLVKYLRKQRDALLNLSANLQLPVGTPGPSQATFGTNTHIQPHAHDHD